VPTHRVDHQQHGDRPTGQDDVTTSHATTDRIATTQNTERAILAVLAGEPPATAAARNAVTAADLTAALALYQAAGRAALETQATSEDWYQIHVEFADWDLAENNMAVHLWPQLRAAETDGALSSWWYIRKAPCWRLRFQAGAAGPTIMKKAVAAMIEDLARRDLVTRWWPGIYEPETCVFGGPEGIAAAHRLFHADSSHILGYLNRTAPDAPANPVLGRRELSILLCSALLRAANLDWHEQGDTWHRVTHMRPLPTDAHTDKMPALTGQIRRLLSLDTGPLSLPDHATGPLAFARTWLAAFTHAGNAIGTAAHEGVLQRGLRDVLAHHVIFHWNRLGLPTRTQGVLARAAFETILNPVHRQPEPGTDVATP